jgi:hypothetical protein
MDLSQHDLEQIAAADRREVNPPVEVEIATWSEAGKLDWLVKERQEWFGRVRGPNGHQRWIRRSDFSRISDRPVAPLSRQSRKARLLWW